MVRYNPERGLPKDHSIKVWSQLAEAVSEMLKYFSHTDPMLKLYRLICRLVLVGQRRSSDTILKGDHPKDHSTKFWSQLADVVSEKKIFKMPLL